jgi:hypothetical protein
MKKTALSLSLVMAHLAQNTFAHDGHGLASSHWHATDALGFVVAAALIAAAFYFGQK